MSLGQATRILPGPAVTGSIVVPAIARIKAVFRTLARRKASSSTLRCESPGQRGRDARSEDRKTRRRRDRFQTVWIIRGMAVDKKGSLYVANEETGTITYLSGRSRARRV